MLTQEQYSRAKISIDNAKSIAQVVSSLTDADNLYLKGRWNSSRICQEAETAGDSLAVKLYCMAEFQIMVLYNYSQCGDLHMSRIGAMQQILMQHTRRNHGFGTV